MIIIPMAGKSRRFIEAGYDKAKYRLPLNGRTVFANAIESFRIYFNKMPFLFVAGDDGDVKDFIAAECRSLGVTDARTHILAASTAGQAETVELGLRAMAVADDMPITIFNIDTFRPGFQIPAAPWCKRSDGYLEVFKGAGANWSYVRPAESEVPLVLETAEKRPISDLCCTGLYHFARAADFLAALAQERKKPSAAELYVAPLYNHMIASNSRIHYNVVAVDDVIFCGIPSEYEALRKMQKIK